MIPYGTQDINEDDIAAVVAVMRSEWLTQGPSIERFEKAIAAFCDVNYAVAVNSATSALHLACLALGVGQGDIVWTSPNTFVASANCALYCGATIDFVDVNDRTFNIDVDLLREKLETAKRKGELPKVVVPVHFAGQSCEMKEIFKLSKQYGFRIIEDASHALGGQYEQSPIGNCQYSDITVFSFHPVKMITTGEGGMAVCNNAKLAAHMLRLRTHGITRDKLLMGDDIDGDWAYQQIELGQNYRITDIQAALGESQLKRLEEFVEKRNIIRAFYDQALSSLPVTLPYLQENVDSSFHLYPVLIDSDNGLRNRKYVYDEMRKNGVGVNVHYIPVHTQPYYRALGFKQGDFPVAEQYYEKTLSLPIFPSMTTEQTEHVVDTLSRALQ